MRKVLIASVMALLLVSCGVKPKISMVNDNYETDYSEVKIQTPKIDIPNESEFSTEINELLNEEVCKAVKDFDKEAATANIAAKSTFDISQTVNYNKNDFISITEEIYRYTGGAHGMTVRHTRNIDILKKQEICLADLFAEEGYENTLNRMLEELTESKPEEYGELWQRPEINKNQDFYITDDDLVIYYQPYELSYYARGFVEFPLRLTELKGYLKEDYYRIAEKGTV